MKSRRIIQKLSNNGVRLADSQADTFTKLSSHLNQISGTFCWKIQLLFRNTTFAVNECNMHNDPPMTLTSHGKDQAQRDHHQGYSAITVSVFLLIMQYASSTGECPNPQKGGGGLFLTGQPTTGKNHHQHSNGPATRP